MLFLSLGKVGTGQGLDYCHDESNEPAYTALNFTIYEAKYTWMGANQGILPISIMIY